MKFTVRSYSDQGVPLTPDGEDEALPSVDADTAIMAARIVTGHDLTDQQRPAMYRRAEVWPYGNPNERVSLFELPNAH